MLRLRWLCVFALSCSASADPSEARDASVAEARVPEARVQDARVLDATMITPREDAALPDGDARAEPMAELTPREVCARTWSVPARDTLSMNDAVPIASFRTLIVDDDGNTLAAGFLLRSFDFGTGALDMADGVQMTTFLLKLDSACKLLWSRSYAPAAGRTIRAPLTLGFDAQKHLVMITGSSVDDAESQLELMTIDAAGNVLGEKVVPQRVGSSSEPRASRRGDVLLTGAYQEALDFGLGSLGAPKAGDRYNVLFGADGTPRRQALFAAPGSSAIAAQRVGPNGELVAWGHDVADYYGTPLAGPTLAKIDAAGKLAWKHELYPANPNNADDAKLDVSEDGSLALWTQHGDGASLAWEQRIRELAPDGTTRWEVPITLKLTDSFFLHQVELGKGTLAAYGAISGAARVGDTELRASSFLDELVMQLDRTGAVRWALTLNRPEVLDAIAVTPRDEVAVVGYAGAIGANDTPTFLRIYAHKDGLL